MSHSPVFTSVQRELFEESPLTVWELTVQIKDVLNEVFAEVAVVGEVSNLKYHANGYIYFTLKDDRAQLRCVIWKVAASRIKFKLENGQELIALGQIDVYAQRGDYQFNIRSITPRGMGALELAFRQLYEKLLSRGWFAPERKKRIPIFPDRIGIVTSKSGAALHDMLRILRERWPLCEIWIAPVPVQGETAAQQMAQTIVQLNQMTHRPQVLIVGRGGGSLEDLWAFNEEVLAAAIVGSQIPIITAVGHETDTTIADLVADLRAATPTAAAALVVPSLVEVQQRLTGASEQLQRLTVHRLQQDAHRLQRIRQHPVMAKPLQRLGELVQRLRTCGERLSAAATGRLHHAERALAQSAAVLAALDPLQVLARGYSLTRDPTSHQPILQADKLSPGQELETLFHQGRILCRVQSIHL